MYQIFNCPCEDHLKLISDHSIDTIITDPPYGMTACEWDSALDLELIWKEYKRILKLNGSIVIFSAQPFTSHLIVSNPKMFRYCWYWEKENGTNYLLTKYQPLRVIEEICVFSNNRNFIFNAEKILLEKPYKHSGARISKLYKKEYMKDFNPKTYTHSHPRNLLNFKRDKMLMPTQKPLALLEYLVKTYSNFGDTILDNTMGSGTTGVACINLDRNFIGIEKDQNNFLMAEKRLKNALDSLLIRL
jgi:site-specific DNA-methyltransferase (adenine-specific)